MLEKKQLRKWTQQKLQQMSEEEREQYAAIITAKVQKLSSWIKADTIALTISRQTEVHTHSLLELGWQQNKAIVVPKTDQKNKTMIFYKIDSFSDLEETYYNLLEPIPSRCQLINTIDIDFVIVPGLAYDEQGYRLGFGGGYYDRFLSTYYGETCSIAFEIQIRNDIPKESFDIPVQKIVTEKRVIQCLA